MFAIRWISGIVGVILLILFTVTFPTLPKWLLVFPVILLAVFVATFVVQFFTTRFNREK
ncbi:MAG TPA: hypothetical protein VEI27_01775 [Dehalococcoidales bacterium]|nr:hypothetical protein [Dehalococcoidales bacterium]